MAATPGSPKSSSAIPTLLQVLFQAHPRGGSSAGCSRASQSSKRSKAMRIRVVTAMPQLVKARHPTLVAAHRVAVDRAAAYLQSLETMPSTRSGRRVTGARCTIVWPPQLPFGRLIARFIYWMCELSHTSPAPAGARHDDACGQGDVSDDERVCRVRARHDSGTRPRRACEGPERGEASWPASDSSCAGETNP